MGGSLRFFRLLDNQSPLEITKNHDATGISSYLWLFSGLGVGPEA